MAERREQNRTDDCGDVPELLSFYLNGSLEEAAARRVEAHLARCAACRQEERDTRTAWALYEGHLPVELLIDYALAQPMSARSLAVVESHLAECERCSGEVATVRQDTMSDQRASGGTLVEPAWPRSTSPASRGTLQSLAWAACLATVVASAGWIWTWRQLVDERSSSSVQTARANLPVVELLPATHTRVRSSSTDPGAAVNQVELPADGGEIILILLSGGGSCESGCVLEIFEAGEAQPRWHVEGLVPSPAGHLTLSLPGYWLLRSRSVLTVRGQASGEVVAEYLVDLEGSTTEGR